MLIGFWPANSLVVAGLRADGRHEAFRDRLPAPRLRLGGILGVDDGRCRRLCGDAACDWTAPLPAHVGGQILADREAIAAYTSSGQLANADTVARLAVTLNARPVRDYAWARMDPAHAVAHQRLWTDLTRLAPLGYRAAPPLSWPSPPGSKATPRSRTSLSTAR